MLVIDVGGTHVTVREGRRVHQRGQPDDAPQSRLQARNPQTQRAPAQAGDSDMVINQKGRVALAADLDVILCVGETLEQREADQFLAIVRAGISEPRAIGERT
jgi:Triosephosphate isomerase